MPRPKPPQVRVARPHPFERAFPRIALVLAFLAVTINGTLRLARTGWAWRRELATGAILALLWWCLDHIVNATWALALTVLLFSAATSLRPFRAWLQGSRTRRLVHRGLAETRTANSTGRLPRIVRLTRTPVGERLYLSMRPGQSAELLDSKVDELRAAARARDVRVTKDPHRSHRVIIDVIRQDPLSASADVCWLDADQDALSMWNPIHLGTSETGQPQRLSFVERSLLVGGEPGSGKSSLLNLLACHAAKSPDAHLVLIDPNEVQFGPWRDRALAYASDDPVEALDVLELVRAEIRRRLSLLRTLPGVVRKVTPEIAHDHGLPLWVLIIDELAFHTSVQGTPGQRAAFSTAARDIVARCRAAGVIPLMATQRPTSDVVPTSLRDLFSLRCAFRTTTTTSSDVILGDAWARRGYSASDIDINARGVGWLLAEGLEPQRLKAAWCCATPRMPMMASLRMPTW